MSLKAALMVIATAALFQFSRQSARDQVAMLRPATTMTPDDSGFDAVSSTVDWEGERSRVWFGSSPRAEVYGWPAEGGMLALQASPVELEFLGLGRLKPTLHPNSDDPTAAKDEEEHCNKMRKLGASWWEDEFAYFERRGDYGDPEPVPGIPGAFFRVGYPADGGVWVLSLSKFDADRRGAGVLFHAYTMEERWRLIKQLNGTFYADPKDCPELNRRCQYGGTFHNPASNLTC